MRYTTFLGILSLALAVSAEQTPFSDSSSSRAKSTKKRRELIFPSHCTWFQLIWHLALKGRFIHITDFHPDPHYKAGATFESGCHRKPKKDKGKGRVPGERGGVEVEGGKERERGKDAVAGKWGSGVS
jgi:hypothetical protein